jgi:hypothetical protein
MRPVHLALAFAFAIRGVANQEAVVDEGTFVILQIGRAHV